MSTFGLGAVVSRAYPASQGCEHQTTAAFEVERVRFTFEQDWLFQELIKEANSGNRLKVL